VNRRYKVLPTAGAILALLLVGCPSVPRKAPPEAAPPPAPTVPREGRPFSIVSNESLLTVAVRRAGALARVGHNHIIASRSLTGTAWVADDPARSSFDIRIPVRELTVDEPELRALAGEEFSAPVPDSAIASAWSIAPDWPIASWGQAGTQSPQWMQFSRTISTTRASGGRAIASVGQTRTHARQATHRDESTESCTS